MYKGQKGAQGDTRRCAGESKRVAQEGDAGGCKGGCRHRVNGS